MRVDSRTGGLRVEIDPRLVEEVVLRGVAGTRREVRFRLGRDRLYAIPDPEESEESFRRFHLRWFHELDYHEPILQTLDELPRIGASVDRCVVAPAISRKEEAAELFVPAAGTGPGGDARPSVGIGVRPETVLDRPRFLAFLRHELLHVNDMLDPGFGYEPELPPSPAGPVHDRLIRDRYRVLWNVSVDGRLQARDAASPGTREARRREFRAAFPALGAAADRAFESLFRDPRPTHSRLAALAVRPEGNGVRPPADCCPLCRFPSVDLHRHRAGLSEATAGRIRGDFPAWTPAHGLCPQCLELYRSRSMSVAAERKLPRPA